MTRDDPVGDELRQAVARWIEFFNAGDYFAAHEVLEELWLHATGPEKSVLKGLIHAAVALHHYERGNRHGARVKSASALRYLAGCDRFAWLDTAALVTDLERFFQPLHDLSVKAPIPDPEWGRPRAKRVG